MKVTAMLAAAFVMGCVAVCLTSSSSAEQSRKEENTLHASGRQTTNSQETSSEHSEAEEGSQPDAGDTVQQGSFWMDQKLRLSKEILTALANADFEELGKNAEIMRGLNRVEKFVRRGPDGYRDQLRQFNMANNALIRASRTENLEAATLAFNQLTISCVSCHRHLREGNG